MLDLFFVYLDILKKKKNKIYNLERNLLYESLFESMKSVERVYFEVRFFLILRGYWI